MADGKKRVEHLPADWVEAVGPQVEASRRWKQATAELLVVHAEWLVLARNQRRRSVPPP